MKDLLRNKRMQVVFIYDMLCSFVAFYGAFFLKYETLSLSSFPIRDDIYIVTLILLFSQLVSFYFAGLYKGIWRFSSVADLIRVIKGSVWGVSLSLLGLFIWNRLDGVPRTIFIINWFLLVIGLGGGRFVYRVMKDQGDLNELIGKLFAFKRVDEDSKLVRILIAGAGSSGEKLLREIINNSNLSFEIVGFVDDDKRKVGRTLHGKKVLGTTSEIPNIVISQSIEKIFVAMPSASGDQLKKVIENCNEANAEFKLLPKLNDIIHGRVELSLLRDVQLEDLLGRDPVKLNMDSIGDMLKDQIVLVTGAGGSIGRELCRQVVRFYPKKIILFEICELFLYELERELKVSSPDIDLVACIGNTRNWDRVDQVFNTYKPDVVLHAAAYKHVPMMEQNPSEAIATNIAGTKVVATTACNHQVKKFVMISTDKAVNPTNIMGTTKRIAEMICQDLNNFFATQFITVRFGNVLGSSGSVVPLFKKQIKNNGPVTVTHPDVERYFMSIPEACQLVLQAATMGDGGEIFVLDMGNPVKITDLAKTLIKLSGLELEKDIQIEFTGLRPGEKLYEELFSCDEKLIETSHPKVKIAKSRMVPDQLQQRVDELSHKSVLHNNGYLISELKDLVPEFETTI